MHWTGGGGGGRWDPISHFLLGQALAWVTGALSTQSQPRPHSSPLEPLFGLRDCVEEGFPPRGGTHEGVGRGST